MKMRWTSVSFACYGKQEDVPFASSFEKELVDQLPEVQLANSLPLQCVQNLLQHVIVRPGFSRQDLTNDSHTVLIKVLPFLPNTRIH